MLKLVKVVLDIPIDEPFDYTCDDINAKVGSRVLVSFGRSSRLGVIIGIKDFEDGPKIYKLKKISQLIDETPILSKEILKTCKWAASYYHHPIGQVVFSSYEHHFIENRKKVQSKLEIGHSARKY